MTQTFATDSNNDLYLGNDGNIVIDNNLLAVRDICANAAKAQLGEMVLAVDQGIPNFQSVWSGNPNIAQFEAALRTTLSNIENVVRIIELDTQINSDILSYHAVILTTYGQIIINGSRGL
jgi:hypothetical protein